MSKRQTGNELFKSQATVPWTSTFDTCQIYTKADLEQQQHREAFCMAAQH